MPGTSTIARTEAIACQRWPGERIAEEQVFVDPVQHVPGLP